MFDFVVSYVVYRLHLIPNCDVINRSPSLYTGHTNIYFLDEFPSLTPKYPHFEINLRGER